MLRETTGQCQRAAWLTLDLSLRSPALPRRIGVKLGCNCSCRASQCTRSDPRLGGKYMDLPFFCGDSLLSPGKNFIVREIDTVYYLSHAPEHRYEPSEVFLAWA